MTNFTIGDFNPLFVSSVTTPTSWPHVSFTAVPQLPHLFYASPIGGAGNPTFRAIDASDLPGSSGTVTSFSSGDLSPLFTTSVANPTTTPALSFSLNSQSANVVFAGPASGGAGAPTFRSLVAADIPGVGGFTNSIEIAMTNLVSYSNGTNFALDFNWPAQTIQATGDIVFNYSTNLSLSSTSRVATVYVPPSPLLRKVFFSSSATNWQTSPYKISAIPTGYGARLNFQCFGLGDSNITCNAFISATLCTSNTTASFCPTNIGGVKLWLDASTGVYYDEFLTIPAFDGAKIRGWKDISGFTLGVTNGATDAQLFYRGPSSAPNNIPCINVLPGTTWLDSPTLSSIPQPMWVFIMFYGRGGDNAQVDAPGSSTRIACFCSETSKNICQLYCTGASNIHFTPGDQVSWRLFTFGANGASSVIRTNGVQAVTGNPGNASITGFRVAADFNNTASISDNYIAEIVVCQSNLTSLQVTNFENYFLTKYGRW